jgi:hypothetical protein
MSDSIGRVIPVAIEDEVKESYLNYAMSVIVSRALPDVTRWAEARSSPDSVRHARDGTPLRQAL